MHENQLKLSTIAKGTSDVGWELEWRERERGQIIEI
jgi:hypothetical protein